jgi:hypothetical protein
MFASLPQRSVLRIAGRVRSVSADAMIDSRSGMTDHLARIQVDDDQLAQAAPGVELTPGMPATAAPGLWSNMTRASCQPV